MFEVGQKIKIIDGDSMGIDDYDGEILTIIDVHKEGANDVATLDRFRWEVIDYWVEAGYAEVVV